MPMPLRCASYSRISPTPETEVGANYSIASQKRAMADRARAKGYAEPMEFVDDNYSGASLERPELEKLREMIRARALDVVLVYSPDRLTRNLAHALLLREEAAKHGVALEFLSGDYADSPEGRLMYSMQSVIGEFEREKFRERSARGRREKAKQGFVVGAVPFGYRYLGRSEGERGKMVIDPEAADTVRTIFAWASEGLTMYQIRNRLNERGIKSARGGLWSRTTVHQILRNETFAGRVPSLTGVTIPCPAIVDETVFQAVAARLARNRAVRVGRPSKKYLLRGMLFCAKCGARCISSPNHGYPLYRCGNIDYLVSRRRCAAAGVAQTRIEPTVWQAIWEALTRPAFLYRMAKAYCEAAKSATDAPDLEKRLDRLRRREQRAVEILRDPDVAFIEAKRELTAIRAEMAALEAESRRAGQVMTLPPQHRIAAACREVTRKEPQTFEDRRAVLEEVVTEVRFSDDEVEIQARLPLGSGPKNCHKGVCPNA
jgi:site-specific DNA recombinase